MTYIDAVILGVVQGLTEFLPISSSGHLILTRTLFGMSDINGLAFDSMLQLATALAVIVYFFPDLWLLAQTGLRKLGRLPVNKRDETLMYALMIATVPAVILGLSLETLMESVFRNPLFVAGILLLGSFLFIYAEWVYHKTPQTNVMTVKKGFQIGLFQSLALLPGMSRSGATIAGGMLLGLSRSEAARFSFLMAVPVITGAGLKKFIELLSSEETVQWIPVFIGSSVAFIVGLFAIHFMLRFVQKNSLWPFIWYRIILAAFVAFVVLFG
jgi:undecaprenyl-diphosphatase